MKATIATVKSFVKKNAGKILIDVHGSFDPSEDGVRYKENHGFTLAEMVEPTTNTLGVKGAWFVGRSRDFITAFEKDGLQGFEIDNSCGSFVIAVKKGE